MIAARRSPRIAASGARLDRLAREHVLALTTIELVRHRLRPERVVPAITSARVPDCDGEFTGHTWRSVLDGVEHLALVMGDVSGAERVLVRVQSECPAGDGFGSRRCDVGARPDDALCATAGERRGVLVHLRGHERRGICLGHKPQAYNLQEDGFDTVDASVRVSLPVDPRDDRIRAQILTDLGVKRMRLMSNNLSKYAGLKGAGWRSGAGNVSTRAAALGQEAETADAGKNRTDCGQAMSDLIDQADGPAGLTESRPVVGSHC